MAEPCILGCCSGGKSEKIWRWRSVRQKKRQQQSVCCLTRKDIILLPAFKWKVVPALFQGRSGTPRWEKQPSVTCWMCCSRNTWNSCRWMQKTGLGTGKENEAETIAARLPGSGKNKLSIDARKCNNIEKWKSWKNAKKTVDFSLRLWYYNLRPVRTGQEIRRFPKEN